jgi:cbb3-type cytochrome oxidase subunit 1
MKRYPPPLLQISYRNEKIIYVNAWIACGIYIVTAIFWLIPDRRIEKILTS